MKKIFVYFVSFVLFCSAAGAQEIQKSISRDSIRVGDPFRAIVRIALPPGADIVLPDSLAPTEDVENAGRVRIRRDTINGQAVVVAAYPLAAWRTGKLELPIIGAMYNAPAGRQSMAISLPAIDVVSVLPADTTGIKPKPPKDVLGADRLWWPWIVAALLLLALLALAYWLWRRRRRPQSEEVLIPAIMPRERALQELERIHALRLIEQKEYKRFYTLVSEVLRQYMQTVERSWSTHLTTEELATRTGMEAKPVMAVLRQADLVKFARSIPSAETADGDLERSSAWVRDYPPVPAERVA